jgi:hypothetical protein
LLALKDGELLAKGEVFEHQTAARPKPAKHGSEPEPKQVKHGNKVIADPLAACPTKLLISKPDRVVMRHSNEIERLFRRLKGFRRIFSRFDKLDLAFLGFLHFALIVEALRYLNSVNTP